MRIHIVKLGETVESIAQSFLLSTARAGEIRQLNNLVAVYPGLKIKIPNLFEIPSEKIEGTGLVVNGQPVESVPEIIVTEALDSIAGTFDFSLPNESIFRDLFKPYEYQDVEIYSGGDKVITGTVLNPSPDIKTIVVSGLGKPGILSSMNIPTGLYPRTFYKTSLKTIFEKYCNLFGIEVEIDPDAREQANLKFEKTAISPDEYLSTYLRSLARQRGLIVCSNPDGKLRVARTLSGPEPVLDLVSPEGANVKYDANMIYSDYTVLVAGNTVRPPAQANTKIDINVFRQNIIQQTERTNESAQDYLQNQVARSLVSSFSLDIPLPFVRNANNELIRPGQKITVEAPELFIKKPTDFIILSTRLRFASGSNSCNIGVVPSGWLEGDFIKFWE